MYGTGSDDCIDILIEDNEIYENPHNSGMNIDGLRVVVRNNTLRANGGTAIDFYGCRDSQMIGNTVAGHTGVHANGLTLYLSCSNCLVAYNHVTGGMVALTVKESTNITAAYNVLHSVDGNYAVADWGKCDGLYYYNNIMLTDSDDGSALSVGSTTTNVVAKNNIMDGSPVAYRGGVSENNIFTSLMWMQDAGDLGPGEFQATREALFVDPANLDFRLRDSSPAIDAGVAIPGLTRDFAGTPVPQGAAPDAGAFEYVDELAGDCDGDGDVDLDDFVVLKHNFGRTDVTAGPAQGDCDSDGDVDLDDFVILKSNFGTAG
mgnify:CR=1 FL=1